MGSTDWASVFDALRNRYRRRVLVKLLNHRASMNEDTIFEDVHAGEKAIKQFQAEMYHNHLPHLAEAGFIVWDRSTQKVGLGPRFNEIRPILDLLNSHADELPEGWV